MADPYTTPDDVRIAYPAIAGTKFSDDLLAGLIAEFEQILERARGVAYRRRTATESRRAAGCGTFQVSWPVNVEITSVSTDGTALAEDQLDALNPVGDDCLISGGAWARGARMVVVYEHGYEEPPPGGVRICGEYVRATALASVGNMPRNAINYSDPDTGFTYRDSTADWSAGRYTGLRVVDDWINTLPDFRIPGIG